MAKVFVVQESLGKNFLSAERFGKLEVLLPPGQIVLSPGPTMYRLRKNLADYCDDDYILCMGDPIAIALAAIVAATINAGKVNFLKWDREQSRYFPVKTNAFQKPSEDPE